MINVCYSLDRNMELCGFVSLCSMLRHAKEEVSVTLVYESDSNLKCRLWKAKLAELDLAAHITCFEISNSAFQHCRSQFGSHAAYLIFYGALMTSGDKLLCIDADTVITDDIATLYNTALGDKKVAMFQSGVCGTRSWNEKTVLKQNGKKQDDPYFGSAVVLINADDFRKSGRFDQCLAVASKHPFHLMLWDQTVMNCIYDRNEVLDLTGNFSRWAQETPRFGRVPVFEPGLIHCIGTPKPWDLLGEFFHPYYNGWSQHARMAGFRHPNLRNYFSRIAYKRAIRSKKQYAVWLKFLAQA